MQTTKLKWAAVVLAAVAVPTVWIGRAVASDHADTPEIAGSPGTDLTDVYAFPSPKTPANVVLVMNVHPLITHATNPSTSFDPSVLYQFKIDNNGDYVEDLVIQARFLGNGPGQQCLISGPTAPTRTGTTSTALPSYTVAGNLDAAFSPTQGMNVFCGHREDPFFFDLEQFFTIFPDRAYPITGISVPEDQADIPQAGTWRAPGVAKDFLIGYNVLSIVVELPKSKLMGGNGNINLWCTTSVPK